jgi:hypothetical protein
MQPTAKPWEEMRRGQAPAGQKTSQARGFSDLVVVIIAIFPVIVAQVLGRA